MFQDMAQRSETFAPSILFNNKKSYFRYCFKTKESAAKKIMTAAEGWAVMSECDLVISDTENVLKKWNTEKEFVIAFWQNGVDGGERGYIGKMVQKVGQTCFLCFIVPSQKYGITVRFQIVHK